MIDEYMIGEVLWLGNRSSSLQEGRAFIAQASFTSDNTKKANPNICCRV